MEDGGRWVLSGELWWLDHDLVENFFFQNNQISQTISLVSKVLKLFRNLTNRVYQTRFLSLKSSLQKSISLKLNLRLIVSISVLSQQEQLFFSNNQNSSSPTIKTILLQQIQANPERPITKSTNPLDQGRDCGSDVDSEPKLDSTGLGGIVFGTAWWFINAGMVLPYPFRWSLQCGFGWVEVQ